MGIDLCFCNQIETPVDINNELNNTNQIHRSKSVRKFRIDKDYFERKCKNKI